ncbi:hypothetical protein [Prosthecobacter vanneervenii]|uniref:Uncharacterized protein n=1 Tax=Prosthecobacter vanneervenii TaxID=48466 RepID=A0A7W8DME9_9BACT|nr:hypothetical protein [Prosthecobacter vanneervenii]MBB5035162.1 hypothetical protein [Prosthecobacter vanneervenii]
MKVNSTEPLPKSAQVAGLGRFLVTCIKTLRFSKADGFIAFFSAVLGTLGYFKPSWLPAGMISFFQGTDSWLPYVFFTTAEVIYRAVSSPYQVFLSCLKRIDELEAQNISLNSALEPHLYISCSPSIDGCKAGFGHAGNGRIFRVEVRNSGIFEINECRAVLLKIEKNGVKLWSGDHITLAFQPSELPDSQCKKISHDVPYYLDVVGVEVGSNRAWRFRPGTKEHHWPTNPHFDDLFQDGVGNYAFTISFTASKTATITKEFRFDWTGDLASAEMHLVS